MDRMPAFLCCWWMKREEPLVKVTFHTDLRYFTPNSPKWHLDRPPPHLDLFKDLPSKILEVLHHILYEHCAGQATVS